MLEIDPKVAELFQLQYAVNTAPSGPAFNAAAKARDALVKTLTPEDKDRVSLIANAALRLVGRYY